MQVYSQLKFLIKHFPIANKALEAAIWIISPVNQLQNMRTVPIAILPLPLGSQKCYVGLALQKPTPTFGLFTSFDRINTAEPIVIIM